MAAVMPSACASAVIVASSAAASILVWLCSSRGAEDDAAERSGGCSCCGCSGSVGCGSAELRCHRFSVREPERLIGSIPSRLPVLACWFLWCSGERIEQRHATLQGMESRILSFRWRLQDFGLGRAAPQRGAGSNTAGGRMRRGRAELSRRDNDYAWGARDSFS